jgi:signal transduction histidine kinase
MAGDYQARIDLEVDPRVDSVWASAALLGRAIGNLVENAVRASRKGHVLVRADEDGDAVRFSVTDSGPSLPEPVRARMFDKFLRLEPGAQQLQRGLVLPFCEAAVLAHEGRIWVEEAQPQGARYCFTVVRRAAEGARRVA